MGLKNSPFSAKQRLLLYATLDDDRLARGDMRATRDSERKIFRSQAYSLPRCSVVEEATVVAALTTTVVGAAAAPAQAVIASPCQLNACIS